MSPKPDVARTGQALLRALGVMGRKPVSAWPGPGWTGDDKCDDWVVGLAKRDWDGPYYTFTDEDIEDGASPTLYEKMGTVRGRALAEALAAHLNALNGGAA
jgi:hypothetical protein